MNILADMRCKMDKTGRNNIVDLLKGLTTQMYYPVRAKPCTFLSIFGQIVSMERGIASNPCGLRLSVMFSSEKCAHARQVEPQTQPPHNDICDKSQP